MIDGRIVTFYSYKGGVGRTFLLSNVAVLLAKWGYRVLCIDWDLEAPGLHNYLQLKPDRPGLVDMVMSFADERPIAWRVLSQCVGIPGADSTDLNAISAGRLDVDYVHRAHALDWAQLYSDRSLGVVLERLVTDWRAAFDFVLIDSPSGVRESAGHLYGAAPGFLSASTGRQPAERARNDGGDQSGNEATSSTSCGQTTAIGADCSFARGIFDERMQAQQWLDALATELAPLYAAWAPADVSPRDLVQLLRVPFSTYWSFGENLPVLEESITDPRNIAHSIATIATVIARRFGGVGELFSGRHQYVAGARRRPARYQVFISYDREDDERASQIAQELEKRDVSVWKDTFDLYPGEGLLAKIRDALDRSHGLVWLAPRLPRPETYQYLELNLFLAKRAWSRARSLAVVTLENSRINSIPRYVSDFARIDGQNLKLATLAERIVATLPQEA